MKTIFVVLVVLTFTVITPRSQAVFGHVKAEQQRRIDAEHRLIEQQHLAVEQQHLIASQQQLATRWQITAFVFGISSVVMIITGTVIGSKTRRDHDL